MANKMRDSTSGSSSGLAPPGPRAILGSTGSASSAGNLLPTRAPAKRPSSIPLDEQPDMQRTRTAFAGFGRLEPEEMDPRDYYQAFEYYNITDDRRGWLRLAWRNDADTMNQCWTSCSFCSDDTCPAPDDERWSPWHGNWAVLDECGIGLRACFDYDGRDHCQTYWQKWTTVWDRPNVAKGWTYIGRDYLGREVLLRPASAIECIADTLGHPEAGASSVPDELAGVAPDLTT